MTKKKLIEVALPLEAINVASAREKSIRHGHPSTLHLWWARRPLAACRAVLFASLVDDPASCPEEFPTEAAQDAERLRLFAIIERLVQWENSNNAEVLAEAHAEIRKSCTPSCPPASRDFEVINEEGHKFDGYKEFGDLPRLEAVAVPIIEAYRRTGAWRGSIGELRGALFLLLRSFRMSYMGGEVEGETLEEFASLYQTIRERWNEVEPEIPPVLDPFCGGGSIPLEAQRLGLEAHGSDLNPVAVLITKALIEIPPKFAGQPPVNPGSHEAKKDKSGKLLSPAESGTWPGATGLADDVRYYGKWMRDEAEKRIGHMYPKAQLPDDMGGGEATIIAWIWARTVKCPNPACGCRMPLVRSFALSTKAGKQAWVEPVVDTTAKTVTFTVKTGTGTPREATVGKRGAICVCCNTPVPLDHVRAEGKAKRMGAQLMAIVAEGKKGRIYLPPTPEQEAVAQAAVPEWSPETELVPNSRHMTPTVYGMMTHAELFTARQLVALSMFSDLVGEAREKVRQDWPQKSANNAKEDAINANAYADAVATYLAFAVSKSSDYFCTIATWANGGEFIRGTFARQAIPMTWDFVECNAFSDSTGNWMNAISWISDVLKVLQSDRMGSVTKQSADASAKMSQGFLFSTDPAYYDAVPYADLSDFFYVWLRRILSTTYPYLFGTMLVPKAAELIADSFRQGGKEAARKFFEDGMRCVFANVRQSAHPDYPVTIYYAFKQAESEADDGDENIIKTVAIASTGWETFLQGVIDAGFQITGTWPMRTERAARSRNIESNALASSIILVCRPRSEDALTATRREFINALRRELEDALIKMMHGNVAPVDLAQATIGPGMAVYSRYKQVIETDGKPLRVRTALQIINQELDTVLAASEGDYDTDTRFCLAWFEQFGMTGGAFGEADVMARAKNTSVAHLDETGVLDAKAGKVRLLKREEYPQDWQPGTADANIPVWECTQQLVRELQERGEGGAARLCHALGSKAEPARDLAYRLYSICERKGWAQEALAYNSLVIAWPEITRLASNPNIAMPHTGLFAGGEL